MATCFYPDKNEQGNKTRKGKVKAKERILSSPPSAIQPTLLPSSSSSSIPNLNENKRSISLGEIQTTTTAVATPSKAPQSPGLRNIANNQQQEINTMCVARALYDYPSVSDLYLEDDAEIQLLRFRRGDEIHVFEKDQSGWWAGKIGGKRGIFPGTYVKVIDDPAILLSSLHRSRSKTASPLINTHKATNSPSSLSSSSSSSLSSSSPYLSTLSNSSISSSPMSSVSSGISLFASTFAVDPKQNKKEQISIEKRLEHLFDPISSVSTEDEIDMYKKQIKEKDTIIAKLTADLSIKTTENKKLYSSFLSYDMDCDKLVEYQKKNIEAEMQLAHNQSLLSNLSLEIQEAQKELKTIREQVAEQKAKLTVIPEEINVAAVQKSLKLQHQMKIMKQQLEEEIVSRKRADSEISDLRQKLAETITSSKSGFNLKIANKINLVLTGMLNTPDLSAEQMTDMLSKLKVAVTALILASPSSSPSCSLSSSPSTSSPSLSPLSPPTTSFFNA